MHSSTTVGPVDVASPLDASPVVASDPASASALSDPGRVVDTDAAPVVLPSSLVEVADPSPSTGGLTEGPQPSPLTIAIAHHQRTLARVHRVDRMHRMDARLDRTRTELFEKIGAKRDDLLAEIEQTNARLDQTNAKLGRLEGSVAELVGHVSTLADHARDLHGRVQTLEDRDGL